MKKYLILSCALAASSAFAATVTINGSAVSGEAQHNSVVSSNSGDDVVLSVDETLKNYHFFGKKDNTMKSMSSTASYIHFFGPYQNGANSGIIDIAAESGEADAMNFAGKFYMNLANLKITNSVGGKNATANLKFDIFELWSMAIAPNNQIQSISFENVKASVTTANGAIIGSTGYNYTPNAASINVAANAEVAWNGAQTVEQNGIINVMGSYTNAGALTLKKGGQAIVDSGATYNINAGGTVAGSITTSGTLNVAGGTTFSNGASIDVIDGNVVFADDTKFGTTAAINISGGTVTATKDLEFGSIISTGGKLVQTTGDGIKIIGNSTLSDNGVWDIKNKVQVNGGASFTLDNSNLNLSGTNQRFILVNDGTITLNQMYKTSRAGGAIPIVFTGTKSGTLIIGGDISLEFINNINDKVANIVLANEDAVLRLVSVDDTLKFKNDNGLAIFNFRENAIFVGDSATESELALVKLYSGMDDSSYIGTAKLVNGWLTAAIPEPAEWAAIFGGIALAIAVYRRRRA